MVLPSSVVWILTPASPNAVNGAETAGPSELSTQVGLG